MTSSVFYGTNQGVMKEIERIKNGLLEQKFNVVRSKIETVPWHPAAPTDTNPVMPKGCYFECHFNVSITSQTQRADLEKIAVESDCHLSRNMRKENQDGTGVIMLTRRSYSLTKEQFIENIKEIKDRILSTGLSVEKEIVEFSIFDTTQTHDASWLK